MHPWERLGRQDGQEKQPSYTHGHEDRRSAGLILISRGGSVQDADESVPKAIRRIQSPSKQCSLLDVLDLGKVGELLIPGEEPQAMAPRKYVP